MAAKWAAGCEALAQIAFDGGPAHRRTLLRCGDALVAGDLWSHLPVGMRRLADGGALNRLVGKCRELIEEDARLWNLDELAGLDLSVDSSGPPKLSGSVEGGRRLSGVRDLMRGIDEAIGPGAGRHSEKYIIANQFLNDRIVRDAGDFSGMGDCRHWRGKYKDRGSRKSNPGYSHWTGPARRVRLWVYAAEIADTAWDDLYGRYELLSPAWRRGRGFVTDWLLGSRFVDLEAGIAGWAADYVVNGDLKLPPPDPAGTGIFVFFTAVEVSEKRGRHWVRLPWCSRMQVHSVVDNLDVSAPEGYVEFADSLGTGSLATAPPRRVEGMEINFLGAWEFWARWNGWDGWILWELGDLTSLELNGAPMAFLDTVELVKLGRDGP